MDEPTSRSTIGESVLSWLLRVECGFRGCEYKRARGGGDIRRPACSTAVRRLVVASLATLLAAYYSLHFVSIDGSASLVLAMVMDLIACVGLCSTVWITPLTLSLGLDEDGGAKLPLTEELAREGVIMDDPTLRRMGIASVLTFLLGFVGDCMYFDAFGLGGGGGNDHGGPIPLPSAPLAVLYALGSLVNAAGIQLGAGYVALAQNVFAAQLQGLARLLEREGERAEHSDGMGVRADNKGAPNEGTTTYGSIRDDDDPSWLGLPNRSPISGRDVALTHAEFRRRMDSLARSFHRLVALSILALGIELVIQVTEGFEKGGDYLTRPQLVGLLCGFCANALSLWFVTSSFGRVPFVSREECAYAAHRWAVLKNGEEGDDRSTAMDAATVMARFPIRFHAGTFELSEEVSKTCTFLLLGLAGIFVGVHLPEL